MSCTRILTTSCLHCPPTFNHRVLQSVTAVGVEHEQSVRLRQFEAAEHKLEELQIRNKAKPVESGEADRHPFSAGHIELSGQHATMLASISSESAKQALTATLFREAEMPALPLLHADVETALYPKPTPVHDHTTASIPTESPPRSNTHTVTSVPAVPKSLPNLFTLPVTRVSSAVLSSSALRSNSPTAAAAATATIAGPPIANDDERLVSLRSGQYIPIHAPAGIRFPFPRLTLPVTAHPLTASGLPHAAAGSSETSMPEASRPMSTTLTPSSPGVRAIGAASPRTRAVIHSSSTSAMHHLALPPSVPGPVAPSPRRRLVTADKSQPEAVHPTQSSVSITIPTAVAVEPSSVTVAAAPRPTPMFSIPTAVSQNLGGFMPPSARSAATVSAAPPAAQPEAKVESTSTLLRVPALPLASVTRAPACVTPLFLPPTPSMPATGPRSTPTNATTSIVRTRKTIGTSASRAPSPSPPIQPPVTVPPPPLAPAEEQRRALTVAEVGLKPLPPSTSSPTASGNTSSDGTDRGAIIYIRLPLAVDPAPTDTLTVGQPIAALVPLLVSATALSAESIAAATVHANAAGATPSTSMSPPPVPVDLADVTALHALSSRLHHRVLVDAARKLYCAHAVQHAGGPAVLDAVFFSDATPYAQTLVENVDGHMVPFLC
jgi:hypothetical protein